MAVFSPPMPPTRHTPPGRSLVCAARPGLLQVKWAIPKSPGGELSREGTQGCFAPDLYGVSFFFLGLLFFADRSLLTKGGGWAGGVGIWSALKWKLEQTCVQTSLSSLFSLPLSVGACGGQRSDAGMLAFIHM